MKEGYIIIIPSKSSDGLWYALGWYGILDSEKAESHFKRLPAGKHLSNCREATESAEKAARELLLKEGFQGKTVQVHIVG